MDIGNRPRVLYPVADGISQGFEKERTEMDGMSWSVEANWHSRSGMMNELWSVGLASGDEDTDELRRHF